MNVYELISKKRDGKKLSDAEIRYLIRNYTSGEIPDYQISALLMAIYLNGMEENETHALTEAMLHSGEVIDLSDIPGVKVDKHSTGGVGDKISIILAPLAAAAGVPVPMISGRGLGHTGGTLDKLQSIPGFRVDYSTSEFKRQLQQNGLCMIGQTATLAPADKKMYALRDVTATVQSIPLIIASIMSKKLAEGIDALVLDVKVGRGAFMQTFEDAKKLAEGLIDTGRRSGKPTIAFLTNMDEPLGYRIGNWLELYECIKALQGDGPEDIMELTLQLGGAMIYLGRKADSINEGVDIARSLIENGRAWATFTNMVRAQEGDLSVVENPEQYPRSQYEHVIKSAGQGYLHHIDALQCGLLAVDLGAGRRRASDDIDPKAGIVLHHKRSHYVEKGEPLMTLYTDRKSALENIDEKIETIVTLSEKPWKGQALIYETLNDYNK